MCSYDSTPPHIYVYTNMHLYTYRYIYTQSGHVAFQERTIIRPVCKYFFYLSNLFSQKNSSGPYCHGIKNIYVDKYV